MLLKESERGEAWLATAVCIILTCFVICYTRVKETWNTSVMWCIMGGGIGFVVGSVIAIFGKLMITTIASTYNKISKEKRIRKETKKLKNEQIQIDKLLEQKNRLLENNLNKREDIEQSNQLVDLLSGIISDVKLTEMAKIVDSKYSVFREIDNINEQVINLAKKYEEIENKNLAEYYRQQVNTK